MCADGGRGADVAWCRSGGSGWWWCGIEAEVSSREVAAAEEAAAEGREYHELIRGSTRHQSRSVVRKNGYERRTDELVREADHEKT
jgi:hypothetical protein